jgi:hypothetical protein
VETFALEMKEASDQTLLLADEAPAPPRTLRQRGERNLPVTLGIFYERGTTPSVACHENQSTALQRQVRSSQKASAASSAKMTP